LAGHLTKYWHLAVDISNSINQDLLVCLNPSMSIHKFTQLLQWKINHDDTDEINHT